MNIRLTHCLAVVAIAMMGFLTPAAAADGVVSKDLQTTLEDAITKLKQWRGSFSALRVKYRWSNPTQLTARLPDLKSNPRKLAGWYHVDEWVWTEQQFSRYSTEVIEDLTLKRREVTGWNDRVRYTALYDGNARFPKELIAGPAGPTGRKVFPFCMPLQWIHLPIGEWLPDMIEKHPITPVEIKLIHDSMCIGFRVTVDSPDIYWLDLQHDGLLRRKDSSLGTTWECEKFQKLKSGQWFPKRGTFNQTEQRDEVYWFDVVDAALNEPMTANDFEPPLFDSTTTVIDKSRVLHSGDNVRPEGAEANKPRSVP